MENPLKEITYKTLKKFRSYDIVLPGEYSKQFQKNANDFNLNLDDEEIILENLSQDKDILNSITDQTSKNLDALSNTTNNAKIAIEKKDASALLEVHNEITRMQDEINSLQEQLCTDALTKAKNRKWFFDFYLHDNAFNDDGYLVFIDLNNFKHINDNYGHIMGDMVLKYLSNYLQKELDKHKTHLVRYAGDEFMMVFNNHLPLNGLIEFLDKIQNKLALQKLKAKTGQSLQFSYSYGLCPFSKDDDFATTLETADENMYENKEKMKSMFFA